MNKRPGDISLEALGKAGAQAAREAVAAARQAGANPTGRLIEEAIAATTDTRGAKTKKVIPGRVA